MNPTVIALVISAALAGAGGFGAAWTMQGRSIDKLKLEARDDIIAQQRSARATTERLTSAVSAAQVSAQGRAVRLAADRDSARTELDRLRIASENAVRNASAGIDACTSAVRTYHLVFTGCASALADMGTDVDRWSNQALMLQDAWPK
jgi:hypothetical protein